MRYLMMIKHAEGYRSEQIPQALQEAMGVFVSESLKSGILKETAGLKPTADGFRIRSRGGSLYQTDGPFVETKEVVGGFAIVDVATDADAREVARQFMDLHRIHWPEFDGECEVRPFEPM